MAGTFDRSNTHQTKGESQANKGCQTAHTPKVRRMTNQLRFVIPLFHSSFVLQALRKSCPHAASDGGGLRAWSQWPSARHLKPTC